MFFLQSFKREQGCNEIFYDLFFFQRKKEIRGRSDQRRNCNKEFSLNRAEIYISWHTCTGHRFAIVMDTIDRFQTGMLATVHAGVSMEAHTDRCTVAGAAIWRHAWHTVCKGKGNTRCRRTTLKPTHTPKRTPVSGVHTTRITPRSTRYVNTHFRMQ